MFIPHGMKLIAVIVGNQSWAEVEKGSPKARYEATVYDVYKLAKSHRSEGRSQDHNDRGHEIVCIRYTEFHPYTKIGLRSQAQDSIEICDREFDLGYRSEVAGE